MRSLAGFNSSYLQGSFGADEYITASALNKIGVGLDMNRAMMSQGVQFTNSAGGVAFTTPQDVVFGGSSTPFLVFLDTVEDVIVVRVLTGTVNNVIPYINGTLMNANYTPITAPTTVGDYMVCVKCKADPAPASFPKTNSEITIEPYPTTDTDTEGYIGLANLNVTPKTGGGVNYNLNQLVSGSLWAERHKYTEPNTASYFFYRV